ncbi:MAG: HAD hydrolase, family IA, variant 3 [Candidatus Woesebacteria bacterium GW2011_GWB1_41_10]|uniref:HAD hydrolase, family IA, variant 3 n=1 Tax=Candidatus Woesebacteria bacterium GW2011_GWB1_41_10 TaxID=1618577 RepID=A0A0G0U9R8_9BACT|nr:MAG: HAD hydrolase, family IA, variant 3 [Candidatus Woesebacteria bacterium GW2011_GWB1_41_10]
MIGAVIFDLDGTVLDNEEKWELAFAAVAAKHEIRNSKSEKWIHTPGIGIKPNWRKITGDEVLSEKLTRETWDEYQNDTSVKIMPGAEELLEEIKDMGYQTALATGSEWHVVEKELEQLNLYLAFDVTTTVDEVLAGKPDPEIYLLTAQKLGVEPSECIVIEDSAAGVTASKEAGMQVIGLKVPGADFVVDSLADAGVVLREYGNKKKDQSD